MATTPIEKESHRVAFFAAALGGILAIYFFVPFIFAIPVAFATRRGIISRQDWKTAFTPVSWLCANVPAYKALLDSETALAVRLNLIALVAAN